MPNGYEELINGGALVYAVPLARLSNMHNKQPLWYAALASHKSYTRCI